MSFFCPLLISLTLPLAAATSTDICLHTVREAQTISYDEVENPVNFDMTVTALSYNKCTFTACGDGIGIALDNRLTNNLVWKPGDIVRVRGEMTITPEERRFPNVRHLEILGHRELPAPVCATRGDILSGNLDFRSATVVGVVQSVFEDDFDKQCVWIALNTSQGIVMAASTKKDTSTTELHHLVDAEVSLTGLVLPGSGRRVGFPSFISINSTNSTNHIRVIRAAPADPFAPASDSRMPSLHRKVFHGTVLARTKDRCFFKATNGRFIETKPRSGGSIPPAPGSRTSVAGFPEIEGTRLRLIESIFRTEPVSSAPETTALPLPIERLFGCADKMKCINPVFHGTLVRLRGRAIPTFPNGTDDGSFGLTDGRNLVLVDCSSFTSSAKPPDSSVIEIDGILLAEFEPVLPAINFPIFRDFRLIPRSPADIRILEYPAWWTPIRLLTVICMLVLAIFGILAWNRALNARATRRGTELAIEQLAHRAAALKIEERTRLAVEIHDAISQTLTGIALLFDSMTDEATTPSLQRFFSVARQMLASCRRELKDCLWDLRTRTFEEKDMTEALRRALQPFDNEVRILIRFNVPRELLSETLAHDILRIVRELVANALRHGHARNISVAGSQDGDTIRFAIEDNGCGFEPANAPGPSDGHFGLQGIRERIKSHRGTIEFASVRPHGTRIRITLNTGDEDNDEG